MLAGIPEVAAFARPEVTAAALAAGCRGRIRLVGTDNDPYNEPGAAVTVGQALEVDTDVVSGGAHLDLDAGYGSWPSVLAWCLDPAVRMTAR